MVKNISLIIIILLVFLTIFLVSCNNLVQNDQNKIHPEKSCLVDSDCLPAECCHPRTAINKDYAPSCEGIACTMNCEPGTLDCGQGEVQCIEGKCKAILTPN